MRAKTVKNNNVQKDSLLKKPNSQKPTQQIKTEYEIKFSTQKNISNQNMKVSKATSLQNNLISSLRICKSNPSFLTTNNGYIKIDMTTSNNYEQYFQRLNLSSPKQSKEVKNLTAQRVFQTKKKLSNVVQSQNTESQQRRLKFQRKTTEKLEKQIMSPLASGSFVLNESMQSVGQIMQENINLKRQLQDIEQKNRILNKKVEGLNPKIYTQKIQKLQNEIQQFELKVLEKDKQIQILKNKVSISEEQKRTITKKLQDLITQQQVFKGGVCQFNLDDSGIAADMVSTAQYIDSLTDLQDQLHQRKTQIFDLNKTLEQLKMKHHFAQLRNQENMRRINQQWENKYKRLMNMYKTLKNNRTDCNKMKKLKTKTQYIDYEKQMLFNLSMSTQKSQMRLE